MKTTKTLMLAAVAALTLGVGSAMAQGEMPSAGEAGYFSGQHQAAPQAVNNGQVQSGSSDVTPMPSGATRAPLNWQTLPTYPGQG